MCPTRWHRSSAGACATVARWNDCSARWAPPSSRSIVGKGRSPPENRQEPQNQVLTPRNRTVKTSGIGRPACHEGWHLATRSHVRYANKRHPTLSDGRRHPIGLDPIRRLPTTAGELSDTNRTKPAGRDRLSINLGYWPLSFPWALVIWHWTFPNGDAYAIPRHASFLRCQRTPLLKCSVPSCNQPRKLGAAAPTSSDNNLSCHHCKSFRISQTKIHTAQISLLWEPSARC